MHRRNPRNCARLEFGHELEYFHENVAKELPAQDVDGVRCKVLRLDIDDREVTLFLKTKDTPLQISVKSPEYEYAMRFLRYEPDRKPDKSLFQLPPACSSRSKAGWSWSTNRVPRHHVRLPLAAWVRRR